MAAWGWGQGGGDRKVDKRLDSIFSRVRDIGFIDNMYFTHGAGAGNAPPPEGPVEVVLDDRAANGGVHFINSRSKCAHRRIQRTALNSRVARQRTHKVHPGNDGGGGGVEVTGVTVHEETFREMRLVFKSNFRKTVKVRNTNHHMHKHMNSNEYVVTIMRLPVFVYIAGTIISVIFQLWGFKYNTK